MDRRSFLTHLALVPTACLTIPAVGHAESYCPEMTELLAQWPSWSEGEVIEANIYTDVWNTIRAALPAYAVFVNSRAALRVRGVPVFAGNCVSHILYRRRSDGRRVAKIAAFDADPWLCPHRVGLVILADRRTTLPHVGTPPTKE